MDENEKFNLEYLQKQLNECQLMINTHSSAMEQAHRQLSGWLVEQGKLLTLIEIQKSVEREVH